MSMTVAMTVAMTEDGCGGETEPRPARRRHSLGVGAHPRVRSLLRGTCTFARVDSESQHGRRSRDGAVMEPDGFIRVIGVCAPGGPRAHGILPDCAQHLRGPGAKLCQISVCGMDERPLNTQLRTTHTLGPRAQVPEAKILVTKGEIFSKVKNSPAFPFLN